MENRLHSLLAYLPYYENIKETYEITLLSVCPPLRPENLNSADRKTVVTRQRLGKYLPTATNIHTIIEL
jgi:hypothetical protein